MSGILEPDHYEIHFMMGLLDSSIDIVTETQLLNEFKARIDQIDPHPNPERAKWENQPNAMCDPDEMMRCINVLLETLPNHSSDPLYAVEESSDVPVLYCVSGTIRICYHTFALAKVPIITTPNDYILLKTTVNSIEHTAPLLVCYNHADLVWP